MKLSSRLKAWADAYLPAEMRLAPEQTRRGRVGISIAFFMAGMFAFLAILRLLAGNPVLAGIDAAIALTCGCAPFVVRRTGAFDVVANAIIGVVFAILTYIAFTNNVPGLNAATVAVMEIPFFAIIVVGFRAGAVWCGLSAAEIVVLGLTEIDNFETLSDAQRVVLTEHGAMFISAIVLFSIGLFYEWGKEESLKRIRVLEGAKREAELAKVRAEAEIRVQASERFASMGRLAAAVAHEVNNPLSYVANNMSYIAKNLDASSHDLREALDDSINGLVRIRGIVDDLRAITRPPSEQNPHPVCLLDAVESASTLAAAHTRTCAQVEVSVDERLHVIASEPRLVQVLLNLLVNAAEALPEGQADEHTIRVVGYTREEFAVLEVQDTGPGIPAEILNRAREPFFTTKAVGEGTGLGLSLAEGIVNQYGGSLEIESEPGHTVIRVVLPLHEATVPVSDAEPTHPSVNEASSTESDGLRDGLRVIICDDDVLVAQALKRHLQQHSVEVVSGGRELLERLRRCADYDIVLCDIMMPDCSGMDVYQGISKLRSALLPRLIFMTGGTFTKRASDFRQLVPNAFLDKPIDIDILSRTMQEVLTAARGGGDAIPFGALPKSGKASLG